MATLKEALAEITGQLATGNIDVTQRPRVRNPDGSVSTVRSMSFSEQPGGPEILIPTVSDDGRILSNDDAIRQYKNTGRHLGVFDSIDSANAAAEALHQDQARNPPRNTLEPKPTPSSSLPRPTVSHETVQQTPIEKDIFTGLVREPVGRTLEGLGGVADLAALVPHLTATVPADLMDYLTTGRDPNRRAQLPKSYAEMARELMGIKPVSEIESVPGQAGALAWQTLGPSVAGKVAGLGRSALVGLGERGSVGPVAKTAEGPIWRDSVSDALEQMPQEKFTPDQLKAHLGKFKTKEQVEWTGLNDWLADKPTVTKGEVRQFVKENPFRLEETVLTDAPLGDAPGQPHTRFDIYQTGGGGKYHELVLKLPTKENAEVFRHEQHWPGEDNPLAHARFNERVDVDNVPTLHAEEIQSDWHQEGRQHGYGGKEETQAVKRQYDDALAARNRAHQAVRDEEINDALSPFEELTNGVGVDRQERLDQLRMQREEADRRFEEAMEATNAINARVPDAPLKTQWPITMMKRLVRWAVDHGQEQVTWTTGDMQAQRYNQQLKGITRAVHEPGGSWTVWLEGKGDVDLTKEQGAELQKLLGDRKGKVIEKVGRGQQYEEYNFADDPLTIGGHGMKKFYDEMIPNKLNKWAEKYGGKVDKTEINAPSRQAEDMGRRSGSMIYSPPITVHRLRITPEMKEAVKKGMDLSSREDRDNAFA